MRVKPQATQNLHLMKGNTTMSSALIFGFESYRPYHFHLAIDPIEGISDRESLPLRSGESEGFKVVSGAESPQFFLLDEHGDVLMFEDYWEVLVASMNRMRRTWLSTTS